MNTTRPHLLAPPTLLSRPPCGPLSWSLSSLALTGAVLLGGCAAPSRPKPPPPTAEPVPPAAPGAADQQRRGDFDKALDSWHGATVQELLRKMGKPEAITRRADGSFDYRYSKSTRAGADGRAAFSCTVRYVVDAPARQVIGHSIEGC